MTRLFFKKPLYFFIFLSLITIIFLLVNYNYFVSKYEEIEKKQNQKDLINYITLINSNYSNFDSLDLEAKENILKMATNFFDTYETHDMNSIKNENIDKLNTIKKNIKTITNISYYTISNKLYFFNDKKEIIFVINTKKEKRCLKLGKSTTLYLSIAILILFAFIIFIFQYFQKNLQIANENLEEDVEKRTMQIKHAMKELEKVNLKLYDLAHTDYLTQVKNRRSFFMHAENLLSHIKKSDKLLSVIMIDIDNFKSINDTYGHDIGDAVLIKFTETINNILDESAIFGRLGGEEFAIVVPEMGVDEAEKVAEKIRKAIEDIEISASDKTLKITSSFGVHDSIDCNTIDEIIKYSDKNLYTAKNSGKNRVRSRNS